jgi:hypothetical protein
MAQQHFKSAAAFQVSSSISSQQQHFKSAAAFHVSKSASASAVSDRDEVGRNPHFLFLISSCQPLSELFL